MDIKAVAGAITESDADTLIIYLLEDSTNFGDATKAVDDAVGGWLSELVESGEFTGKSGQAAVLYPRGTITAKRVIVVGLGPVEKHGMESVRRGSAVGIKKARELKAVNVATVTAGTGKGGLGISDSAQSVVEGVRLALYQYHGQKSSDAPENTLASLAIFVADEAEAKTGIAQGEAFAVGTLTARELVNLPPNICTPEHMANYASRMAGEVGLHVEVLGRQQMQALKMGALLGVAQGSETPPRFIVLEHNADKKDDLPTVVLVGKGVTFDTGGYTLKSRDGMIGMKGDMGGGAAVIGAMRTVALLNVNAHVVGLIPAADNMISGRAYRPQDVITASNGKTIEIISTDAEGRLLLADALVYAKRYQPSAVVDIATLTGSALGALGKAASGLFTEDEGVRDVLMAAGESTQERLWSLPMFPEYARTLESLTADTKNSGGRLGGASVAALFLSNFVDYPVWAHIDMAGKEFDLPDIPYIPAGASGYGARLLSEFARRWAEKE